MENEMQVLDHTGHTQIKWKPKDPESVAVARAAFEAMRAKGYRAFESKKGEPGRRVDEFDPTVRRLVFVPHMAGG